MAGGLAPGPEDPDEERRHERLRVLDLSAVGLAFPIALLLGYFAGRTIGGWLGSAQLGAMIGTLIGIAGGFYNLFKMVARLAPRRAGTAGPRPGTVAPPAPARQAAGADLESDAELEPDAPLEPDAEREP